MYKCSLISNGLCITSSLRIKFCCRFKSKEKIYFDKPLKDILNNSYLLDIKSKNSKYFDECKKCYEQEINSNSSIRLNNRENFEEKNEGKIQYLEVSLSKKCNLKCLSCSSDQSTAWQNDDIELSKNNELKRPTNQKYESLNFDFFDTDSLKYLRYLKVLGGEPFINNDILKLFEKIEFKEKINLEIYTNGTIFPNDKILQELKKFKQINIFLSIDSVGKRNEYIRYPSNWNTIEENTKKYLKIQKENPKFIIGLSTCLSALSILYIPELIKWWESLGNKLTRYTHFIYITDPKYIRCDVLPKEILDICIQNIKNIKIKNEKLKLNRIIKSLQNFKRESTLEIFKEYINETDKLRNIQMKDYLPELNEILEKYENN